jgi:hypothetical protein
MARAKSQAELQIRLPNDEIGMTRREEIL